LIQLAKQLDPDLVMAKLDEIGKHVKKISRGVVSGYDFNGNNVREQLSSLLGTKSVSFRRC